MIYLSPQEQFVKAAKDYLHAGFTIIPLKPYSKEAVSRTELLSSEESLDRFLRKNQGGLAGIGLAMGWESHSIIALDFDREDVYRTWQDQYNLSTPVSQTAKGFHVLVRVKNVPPRQKLSTGIDIISQGWWIAVWPSFHPSGKQYQWLPYPHVFLSDAIAKVDDLSQIGIIIEKHWPEPSYGDEEGDWDEERCPHGDYWDECNICSDEAVSRGVVI